MVHIDKTGQGGHLPKFSLGHSEPTDVPVDNPIEILE